MERPSILPLNKFIAFCRWILQVGEHIRCEHIYCDTFVSNPLHWNCINKFAKKNSTHPKCFPLNCIIPPPQKKESNSCPNEKLEI